MCEQLGDRVSTRRGDVSSFQYRAGRVLFGSCAEGILVHRSRSSVGATAKGVVASLYAGANFVRSVFCVVTLGVRRCDRVVNCGHAANRDRAGVYALVLTVE